MKKTNLSPKDNAVTKKGYNEKNPGQPQGAFPPASGNYKPGKKEIKSNTAGKKAKEDEQ
jgi:hypothetical protein